MNSQITHLLNTIFQHAIRAAQPALTLPAYLPAPPKGRTIVIGAGKASAAMAQAVEQHWPTPLSGLVITRYGHALPCRQIEIVEASHPLPDAAGLAASSRMLQLLHGLTADDLVLCLLSGGGSALLSQPAPGLTLADKQQVCNQLLRSGATISEINCLRKHLSAIKGGRLALACAPAQLCTLAISDVPGDEPTVIASGPTVADPSSCADALAIAARYGINLPSAARQTLESGAGETPKPGDPRLAHSEFRLIATPQQALEAAARLAQSQGLPAYILSDRMEGEAQQLALMHAALAQQIVRHQQPFQRPCLILSGGESTVTLGASGGKGGRNSEFLLALALALDCLPGVYALAADSDGIDGSEDNAGALISPDTLHRAKQLGLDGRDYLARHDSYRYFAQLGDLLHSGPTQTNVNDFRALLIL